MNALGNHNERSRETKNADPAKTHLNRKIISTDNLTQSINERIREGYTGKTAIRKDAVTSISMILTGSHEPMNRLIEQNRLDEWVNANLKWVGDTFGKENIVMFTLHMDEKTPHIHAIIVPITPDGRLSAKEVMGEKKTLRGYQDSYALAMDRFGMERGVRKTKDSKVRHVDINDYYKLVNQDLPEKRKELEGLKTGIEDFSRLKATKDIFDRLTGQGELKALKNDNNALKSENLTLRGEISQLKGDNENLRGKMGKFQGEIQRLNIRINEIQNEISVKLSQVQGRTMQAVNRFLKEKLHVDFKLEARGIDSPAIVAIDGKGKGLER